MMLAQKLATNVILCFIAIFTMQKDAQKGVKINTEQILKS
jgi:hypothetical protein